MKTIKKKQTIPGFEVFSNVVVSQVDIQKFKVKNTTLNLCYSGKAGNPLQIIVGRGILLE